MIFDNEQQIRHRDVFINECRQKAWGALCHVEWVVKQINEWIESYTELLKKEEELKTQYAAVKSDNSIDYKQRKEQLQTLMGQQDSLGKRIKQLATQIQQAQDSMSKIHATVENNLALAKFAENWSWPIPAENASTQTPDTPAV